MHNAFSDLEKFLGLEDTIQLGRDKIAVFGIGAVGSYVVEALARCGIGSMTLVDYGMISEEDVNRQLYAIGSTIGKSKVQAAKERVHQIDEDILVHTYETHYGEDTAGMFDLHAFDYVVDAFGDLPSKLLLIEHAKACKVPVLSCMDISGKINPSRLEISDISRVMICPMGKAIRSELRRKGISKVKALYSREYRKKGTAARTGNISYMPGIAGNLIAGEVVRDLLQKHD